MDCKFRDDMLGDKLDSVVSRLDLLVGKLVDSATDKNYIPMKTHLITMIVTIGLLGGIQVFNSYVEGQKLERIKRSVESTVAQVPAGGDVKP